MRAHARTPCFGAGICIGFIPTRAHSRHEFEAKVTNTLQHYEYFIYGNYGRPVEYAPGLSGPWVMICEKTGLRRIPVDGSGRRYVWDEPEAVTAQ